MANRPAPVVVRCARAIALAAAVLACAAAAATDTPAARASVLTLFSYGDGGAGVEIFRDEFRRTITTAGIPVNDLYFEYLDLERTKGSPDYRAQLRELLQDKYSGRSIAAIVAVQQPALDFLLHEGRHIAPAVPVITLQAPAPSAEAADGRRIVAQLTQFDVTGTLARAFELFPATKRVVFVAGSSEADRRVAAEALEAASPWRRSVEFETTSELTLERLLERVAALPPQTIVVFTQYNRDVGGRVIVSYEVEGLVAKAANAPVFGLYDFNVANGGIGGSVVNVQDLGRKTANLVLSARAGKLRLDGPVTPVRNPPMPMFDWKQIERWGGDTSRLPSDSIFVNRKPTFWEDHRALVVASLIVFLLQSSTIAGLMIHRRRRLAAEKLLLESERSYRARLDVALEHKRQYEEGLELLLDLNQHAGNMTERQICDRALDIAAKTTKSRLGYLHLLNDDRNTIALITWNAEALAHCTRAHDTHYPLDRAGVWADCARSRGYVIHNDYQNMTGKKTCPEGHAHLVRHMSAAAHDDSGTRMIIGVGNKADDYVEEDAQQLQLIANEVQKIVMRRRTEDALHESEARFRFIADQSPGMVWVANPDKGCTWVNKTWLNFTGTSMKQALGDGWMKSVHSDDAEAGFADFSRHFDARAPFVQELRVRRHDGEYRWLLNSGQPRFDDAGEFKGYVGMCLDITERKEAVQQLNKLWLAVEQTSHSIVITDLDARIEYVNRAFSEISGYAPEEVLGRNAGILKSDRTPPAVYESMWSSLKRGDVWQGELHNRRKSGEIYIESVRISPVRQNDGRITHYLAIKEDVTEHKRQANAIHESKVLLQQVIDSTHDWIYVKDRQHRFMLVNERFANDFNRTPADMIGGLDSDFLPPELCAGSREKGVAGLHEHDNAVLGGERVQLPAVRVTFENGESRIFDMFKEPLRDAAQDVYGVLCYCHDATERFNKMQEQQSLQLQLWQAQKMQVIGQLTGGIAHDFNNILAAMFGYAELAQMSPVLQQNSQLSQYLLEIMQAGIRAKELVSQLLTFSRKREAATEPISIAPIVKEVTKLLRSTMPATISIETKLPKNLPPALVSAVQLHQVLMNLGVNARDAIEGKGRIEIAAAEAVVDAPRICDSCHVDFSGRFVTIAVKDSGTGILPEDVIKIFDPFFTTKEVGQGSGLGLSVVHGIVHSANGHIEVRSAGGAGTEFRVYLPAQACDAELPRNDAVAAAAQAPLHGHVLVVDDEASIVGFVTALLENVGCRVTGFTSAAEALQLFRKDPHDVDMVITDQTMPDLTGAELARALLAVRGDLPIVLFTGYSNVLDDETARRIGIRRFLMKPVPARVLTDVVADCLAAAKPRLKDCGGPSGAA